MIMKIWIWISRIFTSILRWYLESFKKIRKNKELNPYFLTLTVFLTVLVEYFALYVTFLPTLSFFNTFFLMVTLATPFLLVFPVYFWPLNWKMTFLPLTALPLIFKVAFRTSFLADFLILTFFKVNLMTFAFLAGVTGLEVTLNVFVLVLSANIPFDLYVAVTV